MIDAINSNSLYLPLLCFTAQFYCSLDCDVVELFTVSTSSDSTVATICLSYTNCCVATAIAQKFETPCVGTDFCYLKVYSCVS